MTRRPIGEHLDHKFKDPDVIRPRVFTNGRVSINYLDKAGNYAGNIFFDKEDVIALAKAAGVTAEDLA